MFKDILNRSHSDIYKYFFNAHYQRHNIARLQHLESLSLDLSNKKVLEFGAGVGDHTLFYLFKNCEVLPTDSRKELVEFIKKRLGMNAEVIDAEKDLDKIKNLPFYDIIHCYGLLYHVNNPGQFLSSISNKSDILLLETCVSRDENQDGIYLVKEPAENLSQASSGTGCRPTRRWIISKLKEEYNYVYIPKTQPKHDQFPIDWTREFKEGQLIRAVFIASHKEIISSKLTTELPKIYEKW